MRKRKKFHLGNVITDCVIAGVIIVLLSVAVTSFLGKGSKDAAEKKSGTESTALPKTMPAGEGIENYECVIVNKNTNATAFYISFNQNTMTYQELLAAKDRIDTLDQGSYEVRNGKYITVSEKTKAEHSYAKDGDYLIVESELYEGEVPEKDTFDGVFVYEAPKEVKTTVTFKQDGTYEQEVLSYAARSDGGDTTKTTRGTYSRDGKFIQRNAKDGEPLLDFYIYKHKLSNAYYKRMK